MASFQRHCAFGFWKGSLIFDSRKEKEAMGHFGRITSVDDLPPERKLIAYVRKAAELNAAGVKSPAASKPRERKEVIIPDDLQLALGNNAKARKTFEGFSPSNKIEYTKWITGAKREATRNQRLETAIRWLAEGKVRDWKYK
jgi:uncharacterized protein YdeI (YjbR/CyaY-like superfamily)